MEGSIGLFFPQFSQLAENITSIKFMDSFIHFIGKTGFNLTELQLVAVFGNSCIESCISAVVLNQ